MNNSNSELEILINEFLSDDEDNLESIEGIFGSFQTFFKLVDKRKLFHLIMSKIRVDHWKFQDYLIYVLSKNDNKLLNEVLQNIYSNEIKIINDEYYLGIGSRDFEKLFCKNGKLVSDIFFGDITSNDVYEFYYTPDLYYIIDDLNESNTNKLKQIIINEFKNIDVSEIFNDLDEPFYITRDNINKFFKNTKTLVKLFDLKDMSDVSDILISSYLNAESSEMYDQLLDNIIESLEDYGIYLSFDKIEKDTLYAKFNIKVFSDMLKDHFDSGTIRLDYNYIVSDILDMKGCVEIRFPEQVTSYSKLKKIYNEIVSDQL